MKPFELYISYISWGYDGKHRPVLVFSLKKEMTFVYPITSQYENKSEAIQEKYFEIIDWSQAGLTKRSYVDTRNYIPIPIHNIKNRKPIGVLSLKDKHRFLRFLYNKNL